MKKKPLISIIVPIYNVEEYIEKALISLKKQNFLDFEVLMIDDSSDDYSSRIAEKFVKKDERFFLIKNKRNQGLAESRNIGMRFAKGTWIYFFDSDDILPINLFSSLKPYLEKKPDMICFNSYSFNKDIELPQVVQMSSIKRLTRNDAVSSFINNEIEMTAWSYIIKKNIIKDNKISFSKGRLFEDGNFFIKLLCNVNIVYKINYFPGGYFYRKFRQGSIMFKVNHQKSLKQFEDSLFISKDITNSLEKSDQINRFRVKQYIISTFLRLAFEYSDILIHKQTLRTSLFTLILKKSHQYNYKFSYRERLKIVVLKNRIIYKIYYFIKKYSSI